jgi:hypothetical protein
VFSDAQNGVCEQPAAPEEQLKLPGAAEHFAALGVEQLPAGAAQLNRRQLSFVLEYLRCGNARDAARAAGYADPDSDGCRVQKNPAVARMLAAVAAPVAKNATRLIISTWERHEMLCGMIRDERNRPETLRSEAKLLRLNAAADRTAALLGTLLGKIQGVHVTGEVNHQVGGSVQHVHGAAVIPLPADALPALALMRRESVLERTAAPALREATG